MGKVIHMPYVPHPRKTSDRPTIVIDLPEYRRRKLLEAVLRKHREDRWGSVALLRDLTEKMDQ